MRYIIIFAISLFLWSGTISIKYPQQPSTVTASSGHTCTSNKSEGEQLLRYLERGTVSGIHDNGKVLTIGLPAKWRNFSIERQQQTYNTIACYAASLHRPFQFFFSQ